MERGRRRTGWVGWALTFALCLGCTESRSDEKDLGPIQVGDSDLPSATEGTRGSIDSDGGDSKLDAGEPVTLDSAGGDAGDCDCAENSDLIFLLSDDAQLWTFDPRTLEYENLGPTNCPGSSTRTYAMGIDRKAQAWIQYVDSFDIFTVDLINGGGCQPSKYRPHLSEFGLMGLAFSVDSETSQCDRLYGIDLPRYEPWSEGPGIGQLGVFDSEIRDVSRVGRVNFQGGDLSGTGDGRLFGFVGTVTSVPKLVEFDKRDGAERDIRLLIGLDLTTAIALTFWGGDFYLFTERGEPGSDSKLTLMDYDGSDGEPFSLYSIPGEVPLRVVAAASSTCAPFEPIK